MPNYVFPKVDLPKVGRSNFSLDKSLMFSFAPGTLRVLYAKDVLPNDHWEIKIGAAIESMPMLAPLYGKWKARWSWFFEPYSNIYGWMDNNTRRTSEEIIKTNLLTYALAVVAKYDYYDSTSWNEYKPNLNRTEYRDVSTLPNLVANIQSQFNYASAKSPKDFNSILPVASSSIWEDLGWPNGWNGYWTVYGEEIIPTDEIYIVDYENNPQFMQIDEIDYLPNQYLYSPEFLHAVKPFGYLDIIRNYYVNPNFGAVPFVRGYYESLTYPDTEFETNIYNSIGIVEQDVLDYIFKFLRNLPVDDYKRHVTKSTGTADFGSLASLFKVNAPSEDSSDYAIWERAVEFLTDWQKSYATENGGCFLSSYMMDLNKGLMNADTGDFQSYVNTTGGQFAIESFRVQSKLQDLINILDLGRGRFGDWLNSLWSVDISGEIDKPVYLGSHTEIIGTTDIVSTTSVPNGSTAGQQTGFSAGRIKKHKKVKFNSDQYGVIYCIFDFVPYVSYCSAFKREDLKTKFVDIYNPRMAQIGYQDVPRKVLSASTPYNVVNGAYVPGSNKPSVDFVERYATDVYAGLDGDFYRASKFIRFNRNASPDEVVGRQVAWAEYMTDLDEVRGDFALDNSLENWVLTRSYMVETAKYSAYSDIYIKNSDIDFDFSTYLHPGEYNSLFVDSRSDAQNFRQFIKFDVFVKRAIPARTLPHI